MGTLNGQGQEPEDRDLALELANQWMNEVCEHVAAWEASASADPIRKAVHVVIRRILESCRGASALAKDEQYEQAGALLRVAIENLWLVDLFISDHPQAEETMKTWISGKRLKPVLVRRMLAEEFGNGNVRETEQYREFLDKAYEELCNFIHPRSTPPDASSFGRSLFVVVVSAVGLLPAVLSHFGVSIPRELHHRADILTAMLPLLLTSHMPEELQRMVGDFASTMLAIATEVDYGED